MTFARILLALFAFAPFAFAHPIPDIPVQGQFTTGGAATIFVEVDPRSFDPDPNGATSLTHVVFRGYSEEDRADLRQKAGALVKSSVEFFFEPLGRIQPEFTFTFTGKGRAPLAADEDVVVLTGEWKTTVPAGISGWKIRALPGEDLAVVFQNVIDGKTHPRLNVLFPGETSFTLDLTSLASSAPAVAQPGAVSARGSSGDVWSTLRSFYVQGFRHVLPEGLDHILFVLGLFLLSRAWKPLLLQVTAFTVAHTITLTLATLGYVFVPASIVEPIIALSIAAVAIENIFHPRYTHWRLAVVLIFGLIHGLGFASVLSDLHLPQTSLAVGLIGFNLGVEAGQFAVIALAFAATAWLRDPASYRRWIVIPGSALIAAMGLWWTVERTLM
jgi:hypothetical protein